MAWSQRLDGYERPFGDSELPLFLGSQNALGDMFLFLAFRSPSRYLRAERVEIAWSIIRRNNPLLMCKALADEDNPRLSFSPPPTTEAALQEAASALHWSRANRDELISEYMDGPRKLSNDYLSYLIISEQGTDEWNLLMCAPHFIGDGTALHQSTHELLALLSSEKTDAELIEQLSTPKIWIDLLPPSVESRLPVPRSRFARAVCKINYLQALSKEIGGHTLSRIQRGPKRTLMEEREFTEEQTAAILSRCKANGVTVNHALVALCNIAWTRCTSQSPEIPMMLYTAANLRSHLAPHPSDSHWFIALTYFTISLPAFPGNIWYRARQAKAQMQGAVRSPFLPARALLSAASRARRNVSSDAFLPPAGSPELPTRPTSSAALLGVSFIGDLDRTYVRAAYGAGLHLHTVATASRLKPGGILLLGHSFGGRLVVQLCWDSMGFTAGQVERFWTAFTDAIPEFLLC
ncbi:hypothetical protein FB45DRAFT_789120 [Roridomyces roridus]|uniref:Phthiocerol/phthiodiolone dimycocerosyl transferase C-terminal domain-containing protein n=1 Tax=Roridomyces roridus TaxID=1738132 RepID=A0AAD7FSP7_9AGAR|nr:hypothetical protein FB45DRAFT_789120 [Roridomyces roridus]